MFGEKKHIICKKILFQAAGRDNFSCCSMEAKDSDVNSCFGK